MKNLVVYYSWKGNTEVVAKEVHALTGGDLLKLEEKKERKAEKFMGAATAAFFGLKSAIKPIDFSFKGYDNVFIGVQVWAAKTAPAVNTFLSKADFKNKNVYLFITKADPKVPEKIMESVVKRVEKRGGKVVDNFSVTTKMESVITPEELKAPVADWINKLGI